jgi:hypothetical protein
MVLYLDIETVTDPTLSEALIAPLCEAPKSYKTSQAIAGAINSARAKLSLDPDTLAIVAIGWADGNGAVQSVFGGEVVAADLDRVCRLVERARYVVGFNVGFDLRGLSRRAELRGVEPFDDVRLQKYRMADKVIDLQQVVSFGEGPQKGKSLDWYCRRFGVRGSEIASLVAREDWPAVVRHVEADVAQTRNLALRLPGVRRRLQRVPVDLL